jgi:hypothetical protein
MNIHCSFATRDQRTKGKKRRGAVIPLFAIMLPVVLIMAAFAINIAYLELNRTEMIIASDAVSRASGREFMVNNDFNLARQKGRDAGNRNVIAGKPLQLRDSDFVFGQSKRPGLASRYDFTSASGRKNAVEVTVRRDAGSIDGPLPVLLPNPFTKSTINSTYTSRANQLEVDVALVIDRSGSMAYADNEISNPYALPAAAPPGWLFNGPAPNPSRWRDVVFAVNQFLIELEDSPLQEFVSLSTYNHAALIDQDLTQDYDSIRTSLDLYTNYFESGATNIGGGIYEGLGSFMHPSARQHAAKIIVVLTDGIDTVGSDPVYAAQLASDEEIMVFSITFSQEAGIATMAAVANAGKGKHYHASSGTDLNQVFKDIARQLPLLISK